MNEQTKKFRHPGFGRRQAVPYKKGRQIDSSALKQIEDLLAFSKSDNDGK